MLHGHLVHGDAWFFVTRVSAYQAALGTPLDPLALRVLRAPLALVRFEPEITLLAVAAVLVAALSRARSPLIPYRRPAIALLALIAFLVASDVRSSGATHHAERSLLAVWLLAAIVVADMAARLAPRFSMRGRFVLLASAVAGTAAISVALRAETPREPFVDRASEVAIGTRARMHVAAGQRMLVDTPDYGFFAVMAAFGAPERAEPTDDRDPRHKRPSDPLSSPGALQAFLSRNPASWLIAPEARVKTALPDTTPAHREGPFVLVPLAIPTP
jgi:hypothetical protein